MNDTQDSTESTMAARFPTTMAFLSGMAVDLGGELGRAMYTRLSPHQKVPRHSDSGEYYLVRDRYHLAIRSDAGCVLTVGTERALMRAGELWWFDNKLPHEAFNPGDDWRIHLIFDLLPLRR